MKTLIDRFLSKVEKTPGCWNWTAHKNAGGYGRIRTTDGLKLAHRLSWTLFVGEIPADLDVLHHCDSPACVNPKHLFVGTAADNMRDMAAKGRHRSKTKPESFARGENHALAKLNDELVRSIRIRASNGEKQRSIAASNGISEALVSLVVSRKKWTHVE